MPTGFPDYYGGLTLPVTVAEGGTGQTSITVNAILLGAGTSKMVETNIGSANQVLQIPSGGGAPTFQSLTLNVGAISGILPIANGGTGTATPALIAGSNIVLTGAFPNTTIALSATPSITKLDLTETTDVSCLFLHGNTTGPIAAYMSFRDDTASVDRGFIGLAEATNRLLTGSAAGDIAIRADTGKLLLGSSSTTALTIDQSQIVTLAHPLAIASGGTGAANFLDTNLVANAASVNLGGQTGSIAPATLYAVPASRDGLYLIAIYLECTTAGAAGTVTATVTSVDESSNSESKTTASVSLTGLGANLGTGAGSSPFIFYSQASQNITYSTTVTGAVGGPQYSLRIRVLHLG